MFFEFFPSIRTWVEGVEVSNNQIDNRSFILEKLINLIDGNFWKNKEKNRDKEFLWKFNFLIHSLDYDTSEFIALQRDKIGNLPQLMTLLNFEITNSTTRTNSV